MKIFDITIFGIQIAPSYYGLMYALGFLIGYYIIKLRKVIPEKKLDDLLIYMVIGVILGGRIGYILLYNFDSYLVNPIEILKIWEGGMSFHGGMIGVIIAMILFSKIHKINFYKLADQVALVAPIGLALGRFGNYLNGELLGFSGYYGPLNIDGRFPSPLVQMFLEGAVLFIILNFLYKYSLNKLGLVPGMISSLFLILYGVFRIFVEVFFREPDAHIGYILNYFTLGQIYSLPMIIIGLYFYFKLKKKNA